LRVALSVRVTFRVVHAPPPPPPRRSNAKYPLALLSGFLPPDDNIATLHGTHTPTHNRMRTITQRRQPSFLLSLIRARSPSHTRIIRCLCHGASELWEVTSKRFADEPCLGTRTTGPDGLPAGCAHARNNAYARARSAHACTPC
jgi:hypothetical protein